MTQILKMTHIWAKLVYIWSNLVKLVKSDRDWKIYALFH